MGFLGGASGSGQRVQKVEAILLCWRSNPEPEQSKLIGGKSSLFKYAILSTVADLRVNDGVATANLFEIMPKTLYYIATK